MRKTHSKAQILAMKLEMSRKAAEDPEYKKMLMEKIAKIKENRH